MVGQGICRFLLIPLRGRNHLLQMVVALHLPDVGRHGALLGALQAFVAQPDGLDLDGATAGRAELDIGLLDRIGRRSGRFGHDHWSGLRLAFLIRLGSCRFLLSSHSPFVGQCWTTRSR
jgi:hypothetical protein